MTAESTDRTTKKRGVGRPKGTPASKAQREAGKANLSKSNPARAARRAAREAEKAAGEKPRWKQLEDGDITVKDLEMEELARLEVANNDGSWEGRRHQLGVRLQNQMQSELARRVKRGIHAIAPLALDALEEMVEDGDNPAARLAATKLVLEHTVGKVPDVVHVGAETEWDKMGQTAFIIKRGTGSLKELGEAGERDGHEDIVDAELVDEETG